ncbi:MAG: hypothetical protein J0M12_08160 [Deltaproteobacteria bacterium]|nr:hypothetical protein [Deltaproteobacteria bacterium]
MPGPSQDTRGTEQNSNPTVDPTAANPIEDSLRGDKTNFQARQALEQNVRAYVGNMSDAEVLQASRELLESGRLSPRLERELKLSFEEVFAAQNELRENTLRVLASNPERFEKLLGNYSDQDLRDLYTRVYGEKSEIPQSRDEIQKALATREAMAKLVSDPFIAADIANLLLNSGSLSQDERALLQSAFTRINEAMAKMREALTESLVDLLLSDGVPGRDNTLSDGLDPRSRTGQDTGYRTLEESRRNPDGLLEIEDGSKRSQFEREAEILHGVAEEIRRRDEKIEVRKREEEDFDDRLKRAIEELKRENSGLINSIHGIELEQLKFQDPLQHPSKFTLDTRGEVYLYSDAQEAARRRNAA